MDNSLAKKASAYDRDGLVKAEVGKALGALKDFRIEFPFVERPQSIGMLTPDDVFQVNPDSVGVFFRKLENCLKPFGAPQNHGPKVYYKIRLQTEDFKSLLRVAVDPKKSLAEKLDAPWGEIKGLGDDKQIAMEIIFCFNYEGGKLLPIFSISHLRHFVNKFLDKPGNSPKFRSMGEEYASITTELLKAKEDLPVTQAWPTAYFTRFMYDSYPPPDIKQPTTNPSGEGKTINSSTNEQLELQAFVKLLGELQAKGKITGQQFRENRELWMHQQPNDRDVLVWQLRQLLNTEKNKKPDTPRSQPIQKPRRL